MSNTRQFVRKEGGRSVIVASALAAAFAVSACRSTPATPTTATVSPDTWATVDGRNISRDDVEKAYRRTSDPSQTLSEEEALAAKLSVLNELIVQEILLGKARTLKIELPDTEVDNAYAEARKNISESDFDQELKRRGVTAADMRESMRRELHELGLL